MIRQINPSAPSVKRPVRLSDIQNIWSGLENALAADVTTTPRIICGMQVKSDNTISSGVLAYKGKLYFYDATNQYQRLSIGSVVYAMIIENSDDLRTFGDGTARPFDYLQILGIGSSGTVVSQDTLTPSLTVAQLNAWRSPNSVQPYQVVPSMAPVVYSNTHQVASAGDTIYLKDLLTRGVDGRWEVMSLIFQFGIAVQASFILDAESEFNTDPPYQIILPVNISSTTGSDVSIYVKSYGEAMEFEEMITIPQASNTQCLFLTFTNSGASYMLSSYRIANVL